MFKELGFINAICFPDAIVYRYKDVFIFSTPGSSAIYLIKPLEYDYTEKGKISLPRRFYAFKSIDFKGTTVFFKRGKVTIRDPLGNYLRGEACILLLPIENLKKSFFITIDL